MNVSFVDQFCEQDKPAMTGTTAQQSTAISTPTDTALAPALSEKSIADELDAIGRSAPPEAWDDVPPSDSTPASLWADVRRLETEVAQLRGFAAAVLTDWPDYCGAFDGYELQDAAVKHGLLALKDPAPTRPCSEMYCACAEYHGVDANGAFDGPVECYERTPLLGHA